MIAAGSYARLRSFFLAGLAFALILFSQRTAITDLFTAWQTEEYSHGILIPFVAILLAWNRLAAVKPVLRPSWWGILFLVLGGGLQLVAQLSAFDMAAQFGLIFSTAGLCIAFLGRAATRTIAPILVYLIFTIPLPHLVQANLSENLQLLSSTLGVWLLDLLGVPVFQQGNVIDLGGYRLQVVEACSGLRYLFPLMSFGYLIAFLLKDKWWKRLIIFLSTIPITIGLNSLRIAFTGLTVDQWGEKMAEGFIHGFEGWSLFLVCIAVLMGETWILLRIGKRGRFRYEYLSLAKGPLFGTRIERKEPEFAALAVAALLAFVFGTGQIDQRAEIIPPHAPLAAFPLTLGEWRGRQGDIDADVLQSLRLSDYWIADYRRASDNAPVNFYIAYYASQRVGSTTHSPSNCIPGGGWQIDDSQIETIGLPGGSKLTLTRLLIRRGEAAELVYYWFDERGRDLTETYSAKWYLLWDSIFMHRTDGALVRLITPLIGGETEGAAAVRLNEFLAISVPQIKAYIPGPAATN